MNAESNLFFKCYHIFKVHGGELQVESEEGNGAVFCIFIPL